MKYYKFGKLNIVINGTDEYFENVAKAYEIPGFEDYDVKINVAKTAVLTLPRCEKIGSVPVNLADLEWYRDGDVVYMVGYNPPTEEYIFSARIYNNYKNIDVDLLDIKSAQDDSLYIKNVLDLLFRFIAPMHRHINIHSSSIAYKDSGVIFSAPSGTGKSTHTGLWQKYYPDTVIVNDDLPLVSVDNSVCLHGTVWCGTSSINNNVSVPLKAIVFLRRGKTNSVTRLDTVSSLKFLVGEIFKSPVAEIADMQFDLISKILQNVPAYLLKCDISRDAVETVKNVLEGIE